MPNIIKRYWAFLLYIKNIFEMYKRSTIQMQIEQNEAKNRLGNVIEALLEKYTVNDIVFGLVNGQPAEMTKGYMVEMKQSDTLKQAITEMKVTQVIRFDGEKYYVGDFKSQLNECNVEKPIFDIELLQFSQLGASVE